MAPTKPGAGYALYRLASGALVWLLDDDHGGLIPPGCGDDDDDDNESESESSPDNEDTADPDEDSGFAGVAEPGPSFDERGNAIDENGNPISSGDIELSEEPSGPGAPGPEGDTGGGGGGFFSDIIDLLIPIRPIIRPFLPTPPSPTLPPPRTIPLPPTPRPLPPATRAPQLARWSFWQWVKFIASQIANTMIRFGTPQVKAVGIGIKLGVAIADKIAQGISLLTGLFGSPRGAAPAPSGAPPGGAQPGGAQPGGTQPGGTQPGGGATAPGDTGGAGASAPTPAGDRLSADALRRLALIGRAIPRTTARLSSAPNFTTTPDLLSLIAPIPLPGQSPTFPPITNLPPGLSQVSSGSMSSWISTLANLLGITTAAASRLSQSSGITQRFAILGAAPLSNFEDDAPVEWVTFTQEVQDDIISLPDDSPIFGEIGDLFPDIPAPPAPIVIPAPTIPATQDLTLSPDPFAALNIAELECICEALRGLLPTITEHSHTVANEIDVRLRRVEDQLVRIADALKPNELEEKVQGEQLKLAEAFVKGQVLSTELSGQHLDATQLSIEEWIALLNEDKKPQEDQDEKTLAQTSDTIQDWSESGTTARVEHVGIPHGKITSTDAAMIAFAKWVTGTGSPDALNNLWEGFLKSLEEGVRGLDDKAQRMFGALAKKLMSSVIEEIKGVGEVAPAQGFDKAADFLGFALTKGLEAHTLASMMEAMGFLKHFGFNQIAAFVTDQAAFGPIAAATWGRAIGDGLGRPASYQINEITKSRILGEGDAEVMRAKRHIGDDELRQILRWHGYNEHYIDATMEGGWHSPSLREVILASEDTNVTEANVRDWLRGATYKDEDVDTFVRVAMERATRGARQAFLSSVGNLFEAGLIDDGRWSDLVDNLNLRPEAKVFFSLGEGFNYQRKVAEDHRREIEAGFSADAFSEAEARLSLLALGYTESFVDTAIARVNTKRSVKAFTKEKNETEAAIRKVQAVVLQDLREQFHAGEIGEALLLAQLVVTGFTPQFAQAVVSLEKSKLKSKTSTAKASATDKLVRQLIEEKKQNLVAAFRKELIGEEELRSGLLQLGLSTQLVEELVAGEVLRAFRPPSAPKATTSAAK